MPIVDNAIILSAGMSSRFAPLSYERHKALLSVKGEILIERQIKQLLDVGINDIVIVTGYKSDSFSYLQDKFNITLVQNTEYNRRNNHSSIFAARNYIANSYICSSDNYFINNPFEKEVDESYYASVFVSGHTNEWCIETDDDGYIKDVSISGRDSWIMMGHSFWTESFSKKILGIVYDEYDLPVTQNMLWEHIFINHLKDLKMRIRKYPKNSIIEFDSLNDLREFDSSYIENTGSEILIDISSRIGCNQGDIQELSPINDNNTTTGFGFTVYGIRYAYNYKDKTIIKTIL